MTPGLRIGVAVEVPAHRVTGAVVTIGAGRVGVEGPDGTVHSFPMAEVRLTAAPPAAPAPTSARVAGPSRGLSRADLRVFARKAAARLSGVRTEEARWLSALMADYLDLTEARP